MILRLYVIECLFFLMSILVRKKSQTSELAIFIYSWLCTMFHWVQLGEQLAILTLRLDIILTHKTQ